MMLLVLFFIVLAQPVLAGDTYTLYRAGTPVAIDGYPNEPAWVAAPAVDAFKFPWWTEGKKEQTVAKLLWDDEHLYLLFICEDAHIWAEHTGRDDGVSQDDCVEVFTAPNPAQPFSYFNIEMNVLGTFLDQHHPDGPKAPVTEQWDGQGMRIATSIAGSLNDDSDADLYWMLEAAIPLRNFAPVAKNTPPKPGDVWHLNLNRCGGKTNAQHSQRCPSRTDTPQFHAPVDFGKVEFSAQARPF
jgi:hypothetical protein